MRFLIAIGALAACCGQLAFGATTVNVSSVSQLLAAITTENNGAGGDTIAIAPGTYNITSAIVNDYADPNAAISLLKPMTLTSQTGVASSVVINAGGLGIGIVIDSSNVTVQNLSVTNANWGVYGWYYQNGGATPLSGIVVKNVIVTTTNTTSSGHGIEFLNVSSSVIDSCTVTYSYHNGIDLTNANQNVVINNTIQSTDSGGQGDGIALIDSNQNTVSGNTIGSTSTTIGFDGVFLIGSQYNYVGNNNIFNTHNGVTLTLDTGTNIPSIRNWVGNNHMVLHNASGSDGLWFNDISDNNMAFGNDATGAAENGQAVYTSRGNYFLGNVFFANPQGGLFLNSNATGPTADRNVVQQNYLYNHPANGGVTFYGPTNDDVSFNYIAGQASQLSQPIAGLDYQSPGGGTGDRLYSNVIQNLSEGEFITNGTNISLYLNRHFNTPAHYTWVSTNVAWDSGSAVLGGSFYSDLAANGNPSNGSTPYTNIFQDAQGDKGQYVDHYPYQSENLGKNYGVVAQNPAAGETLAAGTYKTISWIDQGCVNVSLTLVSSSNATSLIVSNYADYGFYRWTVPAVTPGAYTVQIACLTSTGAATGVTANTPSFNITTSDLQLLSPQRNLMVNSGQTINVSWIKSANVTAGVNVYIRYADAQAYTLVASGVTNDFVTITPSATATNRANVMISSSTFGDSTDGWFSIRPTNTGQFTLAAASNLYVGTPYLLEWISPTGTDYVNIDLLGGATTNLATNLADFGRYLTLIPAVTGSGMTFRLTFFTYAGANLGTVTSTASSIVAGGGFTEAGGVCAVAVTSTTAPAVPGTAGTLNVAVSGGSCGWTASSAASWLTVPASGTSGTETVTVAANTTGAMRTGTITVAGATITVTQAANNANQIPSLTSISPFQGQGSPATFTLVYGHPNGWAAIQSAEFIINPNWEPGSTNNGCLVEFAPGTQIWTLVGDDGVSTSLQALQGSSTTLSNSQCSLNVGSSSVTGSGTTLTMVANLTFTASFTGQRHIWMEASDYNNLSTNWLVYGVWFPVAQTMVAEPWWQIYDPFTKNWLYSGDPNEYATLGTEGFTQQGELGQVMNVPGTVGGLSNIIWYRAYVNSTASHFWTSDRNEFLTIINQQSAYVGEGVAAFVMPYINAQGQVSPQVTNTVPFWRGVYTGSNLHFWTVATTPFNAATGYGEWPPGYIGEGIACYIFPVGTAQFSSSDPAPSADVLSHETAAKIDDGSPDVVSVSNGASYNRSGVIAPGQVLNIHGRHLGGAVFVNGVAAEVVSERENLIRIVAPRNLAAGAKVTLEVQNEGRRTKPVTLTVAQADPALFVDNVFGRGIAQATNADGTANSAQHAAARGSVVTLYTTGYNAGALSTEVHIGGYPAQIVSTHVSATRSGVIELQVRIPDGVAPAAFQPVVLRVGHLYSQPGAGLAIQ